MKTKLIIVLAAVAMFFTACKKDNSSIADNTIVYDGVTYQMDTRIDPFNPDMAFLDATNEELEFIAYHVPNEAEFLVNKTWNDLTKEWPLFECYGLLEMNIEDGILDGQTYDCVFESGTAKQTYSNKTLTFELDGTLKNGKKLALKLTVTSDWFAY